MALVMNSRELNGKPSTDTERIRPYRAPETLIPLA